MQFHYQNPGRGIDTVVELPAANVEAINDFLQQLANHHKFGEQQFGAIQAAVLFKA